MKKLIHTHAHQRRREDFFISWHLFCEKKPPKFDKQHLFHLKKKLLKRRNFSFDARQLSFFGIMMTTTIKSLSNEAKPTLIFLCLSAMTTMSMNEDPFLFTSSSTTKKERLKND